MTGPTQPPGSKPAPRRELTSAELTILELQTTAAENKKERSHSLRLAMGGAVVSIAIAICGWLYTGHESREANDRTLAAQDERADEDFRREQQQSAYSEFYADVIGLYRAHRELGNTLSCSCLIGDDVDLTEYNGDLERVRSGDTKVLQSYAKVVLVASPDTQKAADAISEFAIGLTDNERYDASVEVIQGRTVEGPDLKEYVTDIEEFPTFLSDFLKSSRRDVSVYEK